jgi:hypothetical protein
MTAILLMQGFAASYERALGPVHHHVQQPQSLRLESHGDVQAGAHTNTHSKAHSNNERHHHAVNDDSVQLDAANIAADDAWDAAASALVVAFALLALSHRLRGFAPGRHVWRAAIAWVCLTAPAAPPLKPPQIA